jgi:phosphopentomutase
MDKDYCIEDIINYANILIEEMYYNNIRIRKIIIRQYDNNFTYIKTRKEIFNKVKFDDTMKSLRFPKIIINNKIQDILNLNCAEVIECNNDDDCIRILGRREEGFYFINFSDFDSYAHKGDALMCLRTLEKLDGFIEKFWKKLKRDDYIIITSDHGVKIINSDLSNAHVLEDVALLCLDKYGYYYFDCKKNGLDYIHNIIHNIQDKRCFGDRYYKL